MIKILNQEVRSIMNLTQPDTYHNNKQELHQLHQPFQTNTQRNTNKAICTSEGAMSPDMPCWKERPAPTQKIIAPEINEDTYLMVV